jgi:hypothetical protein
MRIGREALDKNYVRQGNNSNSSEYMAGWEQRAG